MNSQVFKHIISCKIIKYVTHLIETYCIFNKFLTITSNFDNKTVTAAKFIIVIVIVLTQLFKVHILPLVEYCYITWVPNDKQCKRIEPI
jgi:hypothetical protein